MTTASVSGLRACLFTIDDALFAVDVSAVREVAVIDEWTIVPLAPSHIYGVANLRGDVVPVVDPGELLGAGARPRGRTLRALVMTTVVGDAALVVDNVLGLELLDDLTAVPATAAGVASEWTVGRARRDGRPVTVLDATQVLTALRPVPERQ